MLKVCLIVDTPLPVPAVHGGAVETLATNLVQENEKQHRLDLMIISIADNAAFQKAQYYKHTHFVYLSKARCVPYKYFVHYPLAVLTRLFHAPHSASGFEGTAFYLALKQHSDAIVVEGGDMEGFPSMRRLNIPCAYHLHFNPTHVFANYGYSDLIAVSDFVSKSWNRWNNGIATHNQTVKNGISDFFIKSGNTADRQKIRTKLGLSEDDFAVLYCGRIIPEKGVEQVIQAFATIEDPTLKLILIGSPEFERAQETAYSKRINQEIEKLGDKVITLGYQPHIFIPQYQRACDLQIVPSVWEEAAGLVAVEAMASGIPLIVTRSGGLPEYVSSDAAVILNKDYKLISTLSKAIIDLKNDPVKRKSMSESGVATAQQYTQKNYYDAYVQAVKNMVNRFKSPEGA